MNEFQLLAGDEASLPSGRQRPETITPASLAGHRSVMKKAPQSQPKERTVRRCNLRPTKFSMHPVSQQWR
jgi:hypothetical protein